MVKQKSSTKKKRSNYKIRNWSEYNNSLKQRGNLIIWFDMDTIRHWKYNGPTQRGSQYKYSDIAIEAILKVGQVYHLPLRQTQGFMCAIAQKMNLSIDIPDYTTLCRRKKNLDITLLVRRKNEPIHVVIDSTGVKVYGEGEWKVRQHGVSKRRTWCKLHLAIDEKTGEILAAELTTNAINDAAEVDPLLEQTKETISAFGGDGAYDKRSVYKKLDEVSRKQSRPIKVLIPPQKNAKIWQHGNFKKPPLPRDENLRYIRKHGRKKWKRESGYHRRSLSETAMFRYKKIIGSELSARTIDRQAVESKIGCAILNKMTSLGMPNSYKVQ